MKRTRPRDKRAVGALGIILLGMGVIGLVVRGSDEPDPRDVIGCYIYQQRDPGFVCPSPYPR